MGVSSGVDGAPDGFGWTEALLASAVVLVPLTSRTFFQAGGAHDSVKIQDKRGLRYLHVPGPRLLVSKETVGSKMSTRLSRGHRSNLSAKNNSGQRSTKVDTNDKVSTKTS